MLLFDMSKESCIAEIKLTARAFVGSILIFLKRIRIHFEVSIYLLQGYKNRIYIYKFQNQNMKKFNC